MTSVLVSKAKAQARTWGERAKARAKTIKGTTTKGPMNSGCSANEPDAPTAASTVNQTIAIPHIVRGTAALLDGWIPGGLDAYCSLIVVLLCEKKAVPAQRPFDAGACDHRHRVGHAITKRPTGLFKCKKKRDLAKSHLHPPLEMIQHGFDIRAVLVEVAQHDTALQPRPASFSHRSSVPL